MGKGNLIEEALTESIIGAFYDAYSYLGHGFLEQVCTLALERELLSRGHRVAREVVVPIFYRGSRLTTQRVDLIVDERVVLEIKSTETLHGSATRQLYNYLRATNLEIGLLFHFGPKARFWRVLHRPQSHDPEHPENPKHEYWQLKAYEPARAAVEDADVNASTAGGPDPTPSSCLK
jgi:GxxExxY protein